MYEILTVDGSVWRSEEIPFKHPTSIVNAKRIVQTTGPYIIGTWNFEQDGWIISNEAIVGWRKIEDEASKTET